MKHLLLYSLLLLSLVGYSQDSLLTEFFKANSYSLQLNNGTFSGSGTDLLFDAGKKNQFFMIGESHGMAELPQFTAALFKAFKPFGYKYFATETGPNAAAFLEQNRQAHDWRKKLHAHFRDLPWSIPFYCWTEEWDILEAIDSEGAKNNPRLWGIDQEFAVSFRMFFRQLAAQAADEASKSLAQDYYQRSLDGLAKSKASGHPGPSFMMSATPQDFEKLKAAFANQPKQLPLIEALEESIVIYQLWTKNQAYASNERRAKLMKAQFTNYYRHAEKQDETPPRVMFKLGANHTNRGASPLNIFDIGNFVSEFADMKGQTSFHLLVITREGTQNAYTPFSKDEGDKKLPFSNPTSFNRSDCTALFSALETKEWTLVDTRPLRSAIFKKQLKELDGSILRLIFGFDALLVIPEATASTLAE